MRPKDTETDERCPFCASPNVHLREGMLRVRTVPVVGGPGEDRAFLVFRCLGCGRAFDETETEAGEGLEGLVIPLVKRG
jgi:transposase-like protein